MLKATVKNNGTVDTDEVVQVYIKDLDSPLAVRNYSLCGFKRVSLKAGEEKSVEFTISKMEIVTSQENISVYLQEYPSRIQEVQN